MSWKQRNKMALLRVYILISAIVIRNSMAQESNALLANWLAKQTTDFERAELFRNNEQVALGCEEEKITIKCSNKFTKMQIVKTFYGRDDRTTCPNPVLDTTTLCEEPANDVTKKVIDLCQGENKCKIPVNVDFLGHNGTEICPGIRKFLRIVYKCTQHPKIQKECPKNCSSSCWPLCKEICCSPPPPPTPPPTPPPPPPPPPPSQPSPPSQQEQQQPLSSANSSPPTLVFSKETENSASQSPQSSQQQQQQDKQPSALIPPSQTFSGRTKEEQKNYPPCPMPCSSKCAPLCLLSCCYPIPRPPSPYSLPHLPAAQIPKGFACPSPCSQECLPACTIECCQRTSPGVSSEGTQNTVAAQQQGSRRSQRPYSAGYIAKVGGINLDDQQYNEAKAAWNYRSKIWRQRMNIMRQQQQQQQRATKKATIADRRYLQQYPWQQQRQIYAKNNIPNHEYNRNFYG